MLKKKKKKDEQKRNLSFNSEMCWIAYHSKVPLQGQEEIGLLHTPESIHVSREEKRLL